MIYHLTLRKFSTFFSTYVVMTLEASINGLGAGCSLPINLDIVSARDFPDIVSARDIYHLTLRKFSTFFST